MKPQWQEKKTGNILKTATETESGPFENVGSITVYMYKKVSEDHLQKPAGNNWLLRRTLLYYVTEYIETAVTKPNVYRL
jgi:hypothetical protein